MTTDEVLAVVGDRGMRVVLGTDGQPRLRGRDITQATPRLLRVLRLHRAEIVRRLTPVSRRQFLWRLGHTETEQETDSRFRDPDYYPSGAWWWRNEGERVWQPVPGRNPDGLPPPADEVLPGARQKGLLS